MTAPVRTGSAPDLTGFLLAHAAMRQEFGLLARIAREPLDPARTRLAEDQIALVVGVLHRHHALEDASMWPLLRARVPACGRDLDRLEAEHEQLDPLLAVAADASRPLLERADALQGLHVLLNSHLDHEERVAVPLLRAHVTGGEWDAFDRAAKDSAAGADLPRMFGWIASASTPEQRREALASVPAPVRVLFRVFWWPAYQRRARRLYGPHVPPLMSA